MTTKKLKTIKGYTQLAKTLAQLGVSDHAMDSDVLLEVKRPNGYPLTPWSYSGPDTVAFWKGTDAYYAWPETKHMTYEIWQLTN